MNLVTRFLAARRDKLLMKLGCWLVCFSLVLGLMLPQQRAEALVAELSIAAVASVAVSYLCACGLPLVTQGMDKDALVSSVQRLIQEFLDTELGGITIQGWLGSVWDVAVLAGKLIMGRPLTEEFVDFAQWVAGKYGAQMGMNVVYSDQSVTFVDGTVYNLTTFNYDSLHAYPGAGSSVLTTDSFCLGSEILITGTSKTDYSEIVLYDDYFVSFFNGLNGQYSVFYLCCSFSGSYWGAPFISGVSYPFFYISRGGDLMVGCIVDGDLYLPTSSYYCALGSSVVTSILSHSNFSIDRAPSMSYIPEGIAAEQGIALDVGAASTMDLDQVCQGVLDDVIAGELASTMAAADEKTEPVDPPAEELPDVGELGLPALGQALTSRFPFSIPWDFFRAVQLLAAPAKAPYFEVDFMEPLADDVGGWQGDTTVILDFSEYAIIGQISRWTSTIGFCLMLAGATKRLIWTA